MGSCQDYPSLSLIHMALKRPCFHHRLTQLTHLRTGILREGTPGLKAVGTKSLRRQTLKRCSWVFPWSCPDFHPSQTLFVQVLLWFQELPNILPVHSLCLLKFASITNGTGMGAQESIADNPPVVGWIVSPCPRPPERKKERKKEQTTGHLNNSVSKCDLIWK